MTTIKQQFIKHNRVFKCTICDKIFKKINLKKPIKGRIYTRGVLKHHKTNCKKKRTRNIKAYNNEKRMMQYYENKFGKNRVRQVNNRLFIKDNKKNLIDNPEPKADWMLDNKRIQFKKTKNVYIHNWTKNSHLDYIKRVHKLDLKPGLIKMVLTQKNTILRKLRSKKKSKRTLKKLCILVRIVENNDKIDENLKIKDLQTKKIFVHWDKNKDDNFYYLYGSDGDNLIHMTDSVINKMKIIYDIREIYSNSGSTNLKMQNIFENDKEINDMIKEINERKYEK